MRLDLPFSHFNDDNNDKQSENIGEEEIMLINFDGRKASYD